MTKNITLDMESLNEAIKDFNMWNKGAWLYYNQAENYFNCEVFANDVIQSQTGISDDCFVVFAKNEVDGSTSIAKKRTKYIIDFVELVLDGWSPMQAEYKLA